MARIPERIENDQQYNELLARIVEGARQMELPLTDSEKREKLMWFYDKMCRVAREYRTSEV